MKAITVTAALVGTLLVGLASGAQEKAGHGGENDHVVVTPTAMKWMAAPPSLPPGAQMAVLMGDPSKSGMPYVFRAKLPDGYKVPPHWHSIDENVTVLSGTLLIGKGDKLDPSKTEALPAGSYMSMPKTMRHFAIAKGETVIQVHGIGPFDITYVNPADDPRKGDAKK